MSVFYLFCYFLAHVLAETFYIQIHLCPAWEEKEMLQIKDIKEKKENSLRIFFFFFPEAVSREGSICIIKIFHFEILLPFI